MHTRQRWESNAATAWLIAALGVVNLVDVAVRVDLDSDVGAVVEYDCAGAVLAHDLVALLKLLPCGPPLFAAGVLGIDACSVLNTVPVWLPAAVDVETLADLTAPAGRVGRILLLAMCNGGQDRA